MFVKYKYVCSGVPSSTFVRNIWVLDLASKLRMAIPALNSSVGSRGNLMSILDITSLNTLLEILTLLEALTERGQTWGSGSRGRWCRGGRSTGSTRGRATLPLHSDGKGVQSKSKSTIEKGVRPVVVPGPISGRRERRGSEQGGTVQNNSHKRSSMYPTLYSLIFA